MQQDLPAPIRVPAHPVVIHRDNRVSVAYPRIEVLPDGRLAAGVACNVAWDYFVGGEWLVLVSADGGDTWEAAEDPAIPLNWPGSSTRERHDRATRILPDGTWWATGVVGWQEWAEDERPRALADGRYVTPRPVPGRPESIGVGTSIVFIQKSRDGGASWTRREIQLQTAGWTLGLDRDISVNDGTVVLPLRQRSNDGGQGQFLTLRVTPGDRDRVRLYAVPRDLEGTTGSEAALAYLGGDRVLMLMRADTARGGDGHMLSSWSDDGGRTWTVPVVTTVWGRPPHLLALADGRLLATYGHQRPPFGVMATVSEDGGETWATRTALVAADEDAGLQAVGYHPVTLQLRDGTLFTAYYRERAGRSEAVGVRWPVPW